MREKRYEVIYYIEDQGSPSGLRIQEYFFDDCDIARAKANLLKELGHFPVVVYDTLSQDWVDF